MKTRKNRRKSVYKVVSLEIDRVPLSGGADTAVVRRHTTYVDAFSEDSAKRYVVESHGLWLKDIIACHLVPELN